MATRAQRRHPQKQEWDRWIFPVLAIIGLLMVLAFGISRRDDILDWLNVWPSDQQLQQITWDGTAQSLSKMCIRGCGQNFSFAIVQGQRWPTHGSVANGGCRNFWLPKGTSALVFDYDQDPVSVFYGPEKVKGVCSGVFASADFGVVLEYMRDNPDELGKAKVILPRPR